jgi:signal transduction histidine kinase
LRQRLILSYLSVAVVVLLVLEVPFGILTYRHERDLLISQATEQATAVGIGVGQAMSDRIPGTLGDFVHRYHIEAGGDVLVITRSGTVADDTDGDGAADVAQLRPQVTGALRGKTVSTWIADENRPVAVAGVPVRGMDPGEAPSAGAVFLSLPADSAYDRIHAMWIALAGFALVVLALTGLLSARMASDMTRPLAKLERSVSRLGDGQLSERATPEGPSELRALARAFNGMAVRIEDLVSAQARFVADASHQLRSPLTALRLRLENLESDVGGGAAEESLAGAEREVQRLSRLVDGLLTLSRADGDRPDRDSVNVQEVVEERVEFWEPLATERGVDIRLARTHLGEPMMTLIPGDLEQIVDNLLANSLDVTPEGGGISVELRDTVAGIDVAIIDEGPGMSAEARARAFDRFWQGGQRSGGSGLGLAIVLQLAHRNGAEVELMPAPPPADTASPANPASRASTASRVTAAALAGTAPLAGGIVGARAAGRAAGEAARGGHGDPGQDGKNGGGPAKGPGLQALVHLRALDA